MSLFRNYLGKDQKILELIRDFIIENKTITNLNLGMNLMEINCNWEIFKEMFIKNSSIKSLNLNRTITLSSKEYDKNFFLIIKHF